MTTSEPLPKLSVVVLCNEMAAQIQKHAAIDSFAISAQHSIGEYEIILMDNGSAKVLDEPTQKILPNLNYIYLMREALQP